MGNEEEQSGEQKRRTQDARLFSLSDSFGDSLGKLLGSVVEVHLPVIVLVEEEELDEDSLRLGMLNYIQTAAVFYSSVLRPELRHVGADFRRFLQSGAVPGEALHATP